MKKVIFSLLLLLLSPLSTHAEDQAMLVFDASGSMWGQINGQPKIDIAKEALNKVISNWNEDIHLGLIAYGHRKKGDCQDIQTLVPIGQLDKSGMTSKIQAIKPKGKTPISQSIKKAAEGLRYTEEKATVILISDGKETCNADPCATAKALKSEGIDFITHVIGFDVDKQTGQQLKCIADSTGGEYFSAKNASSLNDAIGQIAKKVQKIKSKPEPKPVIKKLKKNLEMTASEIAEGKWIRASHMIYANDDGERGAYVAHCSSTKQKACFKKIPLGQYILISSYSQLKIETPFNVTAGKLSKLHIIMGQTGKIEITASEKAGGRWIRASNMIYKNDEGERGSYVTNCSSTKAKACLKKIPIGQYIIKSGTKKFKKDTFIEIKSAKTTKIHITFVQFQIGSKCSNMNTNINHEVYASNGRMVYEKKAKCSDVLQVGIDNGHYSLESTTNNVTKTTKFSVGSDHPNQITIDMQKMNKEPSHQDLIDADTQEQSSTSNKGEKPTPNEEKKPEQGSPEQEQSKPVVSESDKQAQQHMPTNNVVTNGISDLGKQMEAMSKQNQSFSNKQLIDENGNVNLPSTEEVQGAMRQAGALINGLSSLGKDLEKGPLAGLKESMKAALPKYEESIECYAKADDLSMVKQCETIEKELVKLAQEKFQVVTGVKSDKEAQLKQHTEWNDAIKQTTVAKKQAELKEIKLILVCFDQGAGFLDLQGCIKNNGKYTAKQSEFEQLGNFLNMFGGVAK